MEKNLERYYLQFERPPYAPSFHPTEEEFGDPISYVAKIKSEAEKYGICKIVPPKTFRPPFCIDKTRFEFTPRVQRLNEIDALFRLRIIFINKLVNFWSLQGQQFRLPHSENKYIDLYRLRQLVKENGGMERVSSQRRWSQIAKVLGFKPATGSMLKQSYIRWVHPYDQSIGDSDDDFVSSSEHGDKDCAQNSSSSRMTPGGSRMMAGSSRMMAGVKAEGLPHVKRKTLKKLDLSTVMCEQCGGGEDEHLLLLCDSCDRSFHTYCLVPPLSCVPKGDWRCPRCVADEVRSQTFEFGFQDSQTLFNLSGFGDWANTFKRNFFKMPAASVPGDKVESAFWASVIDLDTNVQVKYGADLISSKVGSGFPRKDDCRKGLDTKNHQFYANHPWNLNNLPILRESVLSHIDHGISGMMVPWVYVGMCFSTFCWFSFFYDLFYVFNFRGEKKIWYGIPGFHAEDFDRVMRKNAGELFISQPDLLHSLTTSINPRFIMEQGVSVYTVHQESGEFVVTFPRAYHSGYNEGLNFAEAVNFAPPDWLYMGRLCLMNYAAVRRTCVFSHEELVMRMVAGAHKLSLSMCIAALDELRYIVARETEFRKKLSLRGLRESQFCKFEVVHDDARSCHLCRTTLYISALVCRHENHVVCADHIDELCKHCDIGDCCLKYRYTLSELVPLVHKLAERTTTFDDWRARAAIACEPGSTSGKVDVAQLRLLLDQWRTKRYPQCDEVRKASQLLNRFDKLATAVGKIINRKIRLRDNTRIQKADTRPDFQEVERLRQQIRDSEFEDAELEHALDELVFTVQDWKGRAISVLQTGREASVIELRQLLTEADEFTLKMPEYDELKSHLNRCTWLMKAAKMVSAMESSLLMPSKRMRLSPSPIASTSVAIKKCEPLDEGIVVEEEDEGVDRLTKLPAECLDDNLDLNLLGKALAEGSKWSKTCPLVRKNIAELEKMLTNGLAAEEKAQQFLSRPDAEGIGYETAHACLLEIPGTDWLKSENFVAFRDEVDFASQAFSTFQQIINGFTLRSLEQAIAQCERSLFERNGAKHRQLLALFAELKKFTDRLCPLFQKSSSGYYNLFDIIGGRSDLPALVEGDPVVLTLHNSLRHAENWRQLKLFAGLDELGIHLDAVFRQQLALLRALRLVNERRAIRETCLCAQDYPSDNGGAKSVPISSKEIEVISCFLCRGAFHGYHLEMHIVFIKIACAQWEPFLDRLIPGIFLCPRCLRGRRPAIEDVEAACAQASSHSLELCVTKKLLEHSRKVFIKLHDLAQEFPKGTSLEVITQERATELEHTLLHALSLEVWDLSVYRFVFDESACFDLLKFSSQTVSAWNSLRNRINSAVQRPIIFALSLDKSSGAGCEPKGVNGQRKSNSRSAHLNSPSSSPFKRARASSSSAGGDEQLAEQKSTVVYHRDTETCASGTLGCLRPYSDRVRWVQCGDDGRSRGCGLWFHYVCVGLTVAQALSSPDWSCSECLTLKVKYCDEKKPLAESSDLAEVSSTSS